MPLKKNLAYLHELASLRGGRCLSTEYNGMLAKYDWECGKGHKWKATAHNINQKHWCPECAGLKPKNIGWLHELASLRGGKCLSTEYINIQTKYEWECGQGHRWKAKANCIQQGRWCPKCSYLKRADKKRKSIGWLHELASSRGGRCLSIKYINSQTKYEWECGRGHGWSAAATDVANGHWCPECSGIKRKDIAYLHELASRRGGRCLSTEYINSHTKYEWECGKGHGWWAEASNVRSGHWCPHCSNRHSKAELQIYEFVKQSHPDTLNGIMGELPNKRFELDIYVPSLRKAIEFDGEFWHATSEAQERSLRKNQECEAKGIELLRIPEQDFLDNPQQVFEKIKEFLN